MTARRSLGIGMIGAGTMAGVHSHAVRLVAALYPELPLRPRLVAVADVNERLAMQLADRFEYERVESDWRRVVDATDVDLIVACLPPVPNRDVILAAAASGTPVVAEKPLAESADRAKDLLRACQAAGVFHGLGTAYRWTPALRAIRAIIQDGELGEIRSLRASFLLDYGADPDVPLLWRFQRSLAGGGTAIDTGYHVVDCARFLAGEIDMVQALTATFIAERPIPSADAIGNRGAEVALAAVQMGRLKREWASR